MIRLSLAALALAWSGAALADPCAELDGMAEGPVAVGIRPGELGRAHRVCGRSELALGGSAYLLADAPNFYGHIVGTVDLDGSYHLESSRTEVFARAEIVRYDSVIGPLPDAWFGPGWFSAGVAQRIATSEKGALGINAKILLPSHYRNAYPIGVDLGLAAQYAPNTWLRVHGQLSAAFEANAGKGPADPAFGVAPTVGVALRPGRAFAFALDVAGSFGLTAPVDHLAVLPAFRFSDGKRFGFELGLAAPLLGRERALVLADLRFSVLL